MLSVSLVKRVPGHGMVILAMVLLSSRITRGQSESIVLGGSIDLDNYTLVYERGDNVTFTFSVTFNVTNDLDTLNITIWSHILQFASDPVGWTLDGLDNDPVSGSPPHISTTSTQVLDERTSIDDDSYIIFLADIRVNRWVLHGELAMYVKDDAGPGRRVQSFVNITIPIFNGNATTTSVLPSNYAHTPPIQADFTVLDTPIIGIMEVAKTYLSVNVTDDNTAPLIEFISSIEEVSREVMLTVSDVKLNGSGLEPDVLHDVIHTNAQTMSTFKSYQEDIATVQLPLLMNEPGVNASALAAELSVRLEDYTVMADGDELVVGATIKFGDGMIWASATTLTVGAPEAAVRKPQLQLSSVISTICTDQDINKVDIQLTIRHMSNSTATAYLIQMNLYPPPYMSLTSTTSTSPKNYMFSVQTSEYLKLTLGRLTFSDPAGITLKMRVQMNETRTNDQDVVIIPVQIIYNDRWNNSTDLVTPMQYLSVNLNRRCAERFEWASSSSCPCDFDPGRSDCGCCVDYGLVDVTQCGADSPGQCQRPEKPWLCFHRRDGFLDHAVTQGFAGELYNCDASQKYSGRSNSEVSCFKMMAGKWEAMHPIVAVIIGKDRGSEILYGISTYGQAHLISWDKGESWYTMREEDYIIAKSSPDFHPAIIM